MAFILTPPVLTNKKGYGVSICQFGKDEYPEPILLRMLDWGTCDFMRFWRNEICSLLDGARSKAMLVSSICKNTHGERMPDGHWEIFSVGDFFEIRTKRYIPLDTPIPILPPDRWWTIVGDYKREYYVDDDDGVHKPFVECVVTRNDLEKWRVECDFLLNRIECVNIDPTFFPLLGGGSIEKTKYFKIRKGERIFEIIVPTGLSTRHNLFKFYADSFEYPSLFEQTGKTWDDFYSFLDGLPHMPVKQVIIKHRDWPLSKNIRDQKKYINLLNSVINEYKTVDNVAKITVVLPRTRKSSHAVTPNIPSSINVGHDVTPRTMFRPTSGINYWNMQ